MKREGISHISHLGQSLDFLSGILLTMVYLYSYLGAGIVRYMRYTQGACKIGNDFVYHGSRRIDMKCCRYFINAIS
jgi:hypothetical protein